MRKTNCQLCGCARTMMLKADVRVYSENSEVKGYSGYKLTWLCIPCFLEEFGLLNGTPKKFDYNKAMISIR